MATERYGEEQKAVFRARKATQTRTHDVHLPVESLSDEELTEVLELESWGASPKRRGDMVVVPCFFRPYVAAILAH